MRSEPSSSPDGASIYQVVVVENDPRAHLIPPTGADHRADPDCRCQPLIGEGSDHTPYYVHFDR